ncbi:hypothetical protein E2562_001200 [Oryza meyeriana var. granulata]|uniref:Uncharacterized protein n=1 Tax=Oryza meyeriana var. granulata TaxID=110450 RepID=A0A6G1DCP3_9ORYZ|nr:hypothetical protein E2562_001200 [Oryza meyeriana var. granulata]
MEILTVMVILLGAASTGSSARLAPGAAACEPACGGLVGGVAGNGAHDPPARRTTSSPSHIRQPLVLTA